MITQEIRTQLQEYFDESCKELNVDSSAYVLHIIVDKSRFPSIYNSAEWCGRTLYINQEWVEFCIQNKVIYDLIFVLSHEARHIYQHNVIADFNKRGKSCELPAIIKQWEKEFSHYIRNEGDEDSMNKNTSQQVEIDANAFANCILIKKGLEARIKPEQEYLMTKAIKEMARKLWNAEVF